MPRVEPDVPALLYQAQQPALAGALPVLPLISEDELETPPLPRDHPRWVRDAVALSARARSILVKLRPIIVRVMTFWDHHSRSIAVGSRRLNVDSSGSYRIDWDL